MPETAADQAGHIVREAYGRATSGYWGLQGTYQERMARDAIKILSEWEYGTEQERVVFLRHVIEMAQSKATNDDNRTELSY